VVLRRLECALEPTKQAVVVKAAQLDGKPGADAVLRSVSNHRFYNTSPLDPATSGTDRASIGFTGGMTGRRMWASSRTSAAPCPCR
jgi:hypothetical protein